MESSEPTKRHRSLPIRERARAGLRIAVVFGGIMAGITAARILIAEMVPGTALPLNEIGEILLIAMAAFLGFGGLAFFAKLLGVPVFSRDE